LTTTDEEELQVKEDLKANELLPKKQRKKDLKQRLAMNNKSLLLAGHETRMDFDKFKYNEDFVIVPKNVFSSLSQWYVCDQVIEFRAQVHPVNSSAIQAAKKFIKNEDDDEDDV